MPLSSLGRLWSAPPGATPPSIGLAAQLAALLSRPCPMEEVEEIEDAIKQLWRSRLGRPTMDREDAGAFAGFFNKVGFTFKYKPYGVKIASPFGYSLFDLNQNEGFSFQVHTKPKREAFHILKVKEGGFVFLCSRQEWEAGAGDWVRQWARGDQAPGAQPFVWIPVAGQTIPVSAPDVVHTVIGCVLEEFASCSVDAVDRLFDQNSRHSLMLPENHPRIAGIVAGGHPGLPTESVVRSGNGWARSAMDPAGLIIDVPDGFRGARVALSGGRPVVIEPRCGWVTSVTPVNGAVNCRTADSAFTLNAGEILSSAPGWGIEMTAENGAVVAVHSVASEIFLQDWS